MKALSRPIRLLRPTTRHNARARGVAPELLALTAAVAFALFYNTVFWKTVLTGRDPWALATWRFVGATFLLMTALHLIPMLILGGRRLMRPLLIAGLLTAAAAQYFMLRYGTVLDTDMMRNVLHTHAGEAREYLSWGLAVWMLGFALLPLWLLFRWTLTEEPWRKAWRRRLSFLGGGVLAGLAAALVVYQDLSSVLRNHRELHYGISPIGPLWSTGRAVWREFRQAGVARAAPEPAWRAMPAAAHRPLLLVLVVGETARAANFSLLGYTRPTNPRLAGDDVIAFPDMHACGTATEVSLPCMFSPYGRADYDEERIRSHDSVLHVLAHAGVEVTWLDNQSGCKGVCSGLPYVESQQLAAAGQCAQGECYDEVLLQAFDRLPLDAPRDRVVVLHQLGNHGPAYHRRYPPAFARFRPACDSDELRDCSREQIVNAYDNAILYTDHVLDQVVQRLRRRQPGADVALLYVSDHGESLGEHGLYLHGLPYALAPEDQTHVPMLWWLPERSAHALGVDRACLVRHARDPASHDNLYHSLTGLLGVQVATYRPERDLFARCRLPASTAVVRGEAQGDVPATQSARDM